MNPIQRFLYKRWYLDAIYYKVFVSGLLAASRGLYTYVEQGIWNRLNNTIGRDVMEYSRASDQLDTQVVDRAANEIASYGSRLSNLLRKLQSGVTEQYVIAFAIGIILLLDYCQSRYSFPQSWRHRHFCSAGRTRKWQRSWE
jgi:NADH:ubiquinone oxidoreductase subunit 5 (subunit L)/multisubunit Na+/H+ antiporter MnhA subunit